MTGLTNEIVRKLINGYFCRHQFVCFHVRKWMSMMQMVLISPNGNGSLSQNVQSSMKWSEIYADLFYNGLDRPHMMVSGHHGR